MPPRTPYPISGLITDVDGNTSNKCQVIVYNLFNGDSLSTQTGSNGIYMVDTANAEKLWSAGEPLLIRAFIEGTHYRLREARVAISGSSLTQNLTLLVERPEQTKDTQLRHLDRFEHDPIASAKRVILARENTDSGSDAIKTIEFGHAKIHSGDHFFNKDFTDLGNGATYDILVVTPDTTRWGHLIFKVESEAETQMLAYVNALASSNGTPMNVFNRNGNSIKSNTITVFHTPTVSSVGTLIARYKTGSGKAAGGIVRSAFETVLKQNSKYLFRITNSTTSNNWIDWIIDWYENTNKNDN